MLLACYDIEAKRSPCTYEQSIRGENEADRLRSWDSVYRWYKLYARCENAAAQEGVSESITRLLVDRWASIKAFDGLARAHPGFRRFALGGINTTLNMKDVTQIEAQAKSRCPAALHELCKAIESAAAFAIEEDASFHKQGEK